MINREKLMAMATQSPRVQKAVDVIEQRIGAMPLTPELVGEIIQTLEHVLENPAAYPMVRQKAIQAGYASPADLPEKFNPQLVFVLLLAFYGIQGRMGVKKYARGGLHQAARCVANAGRSGDTMLAHINPQEAEMLRRMGGSGHVNPNTGVVEFKSDIGKIIGAVIPVAASVLFPGIGTAIGSAISMGALEGTAASVLGSAIIGGASSALTGGNVLQGAALGGLGAGMGDWLGGAILPEGASEMAKSAIGGGLVGGVAGAVTGQNPLASAALGAAGSALGSGIGGSSAPEWAKSAGKAFGSTLGAAYSPKTALINAATAGILSNFAPKPNSQNTPSSPIANDGIPAGDNPAYWTTTPEVPSPSSDQAFASQISAQGFNGENPYAPTAPQSTGAAPTPGAPASKGINWGAAAVSALPVLGTLFAPQAAQQAVASLPQSQKEYFNRPSVTWDWAAMQRDAAASGLDLGSYISRNWNTVSSGKYNTSGTTPTTPGAARGGPLSQIVRRQPMSTGRSDNIDAKLSDGEYVMDAESVALLGDGSTQAGARKLDEMRRQVRMQKGKALARGQFSPNARSPLAYIKGVA